MKKIIALFAPIALLALGMDSALAAGPTFQDTMTASQASAKSFSSLIYYASLLLGFLFVVVGIVLAVMKNMNPQNQISWKAVLACVLGGALLLGINQAVSIGSSAVGLQSQVDVMGGIK